MVFLIGRPQKNFLIVSSNVIFDFFALDSQSLPEESGCDCASAKQPITFISARVPDSQSVSAMSTPQVTYISRSIELMLSYVYCC